MVTRGDHVDESAHTQTLKVRPSRVAVPLTATHYADLAGTANDREVDVRRQAVTIGLAALAVLDIVLVVMALRGPSLQPAAGEPTPAPTAPTAEAPPTTTGTTGTMEATSPAEASYTPAPLTVMIAALDGSHAWRAQAGDCTNGGSLVQTTTDAGATWSKGTSPAQAIVRVQPVSAAKGFVYGAGDTCGLSEYVSDDAAKTWRDPTGLTGAWSRQAQKATAVVTPAVADAEPCGKESVLDLARASATKAYALCLKGGVKLTTDAGATWSDFGHVKGALSLAYRRDGLYLVRAEAGATCPGLQVVELAHKAAAPLGCVEQPGPAEPGAVSLSVVDGAGWLAVGDETWTSADLKAWTKA